MNELLELRKSIKAKKPKFVRQDSNRMMNDKWRRPRGKSSKMRYNLRGYPRNVEPGWGSPAEVKGLHKSGLKIVLVNSLLDLSKINPKTEGIVISGKLGAKKRINIINEAKKKSIIILNIKPDAYLKRIEEKKKQKKSAKEEKQKRKEQKKKEKKPVAEKKEELTEEQKKELEKQEKDKILTKG